MLYAAGFGGDNTGKIVRTILSRLFAPALAKLINFIGANNKIEFRKLHSLHLVIGKFTSVGLLEISISLNINNFMGFKIVDATRSNAGKEQVTEAEINNIVKTWFQNSRDLDGGRTARKTRKLSDN